MRAKLGTAGVAAAPVSLTPIATKASEVESLDDADLVRDVLRFYRATLLASPEAIAYLESRGLNSVELIDHFSLGYANRTLGYRLPGARWKAGEALRGRLQRLGFLRESGHEHFRGSLVVPIFGARGQLAQAYGRKIGAKLREGTLLHLYLPRPHTAVWNVDALATSKEIILCESLLDAMSFWVAGYRHVITSYGVSGFTDAHRAVLRQYGTERVLIAYDADAAGDEAAAKIADELTKHEIECYRVNFPRGLDANAYMLSERTNASANESLGVVLRAAAWLGKGAPVVPVTAAIADASPLAAAPKPPVAPSASPVPRESAPAIAIEHRGDDVVCTTAGDRTYRVRGLAKNLSPDALRVNLLAQLRDQVHVDTLDLYVARSRGAFIAQAAVELGVSEETIKRDVGAVILALEPIVASQIAGTLAPVMNESASPAMSDADREAALALLRDPQLLGRILADFQRAGIVGEENNKLDRLPRVRLAKLLERPLAVIIQSTGAAGKSTLMDAVLAFFPEEERVKYSAMTGQSLYYLGETNLRHKILAIVEEEGAEKASYALKLLQSEGELTIASTGKDPHTGRMTTQEYHVEGPVMIFLTTTAIDLDEELQNRCLTLAVDECPEQTRASTRCSASGARSPACSRASSGATLLRAASATPSASSRRSTC